MSLWKSRRWTESRPAPKTTLSKVFDDFCWHGKTSPTIRELVSWSGGMSVWWLRSRFRQNFGIIPIGLLPYRACVYSMSEGPEDWHSFLIVNQSCMLTAIHCNNVLPALSSSGTYMDNKKKYGYIRTNAWFVRFSDSDHPETAAISGIHV